MSSAVCLLAALLALVALPFAGDSWLAGASASEQALLSLPVTASLPDQDRLANVMPVTQYDLLTYRRSALHRSDRDMARSKTN